MQFVSSMLSSLTSEAGLTIYEAPKSCELQAKYRMTWLIRLDDSWQRWRYTLGTLYNILADQLPTFAIFVTFFFYTKVFGHQLVPATAFVAITV